MIPKKMTIMARAQTIKERENMYIGLDVGGTTIKAGVVNEEGKILYKEAIPTGVDRPYQEIIGDMANLCMHVAEQARVPMDEIQSIGVGVPGIYDESTGIIPFCTNLGWHDIPFAAEMRKYLNLPVYVANDATVAGFAESIAGVSVGTRSSVFLTLGTGVGGGIIINGRPYSGIHGVGSEIGHMIIHSGGEKCSCGNCGCFERYASATAIIREAKKACKNHPESKMMEAVGGDIEKITGATVFNCAKDGDEVAMKVVTNYCKSLAEGIVNIINFIDPEIIILGGGISMAGEFLLEAVRKEVKPLVFYKSMPYATIQLAQLGSDAGIIGAAMLGKAAE